MVSANYEFLYQLPLGHFSLLSPLIAQDSVSTDTLALIYTRLTLVMRVPTTFCGRSMGVLWAILGYSRS